MAGKRTAAADSTAVRTALWRALHVEIDPPPHIFKDEVGLQLAAPKDGWRQRPDMNPRQTSRARASIVARARFIEELVTAQAALGVRQYVILGAGLDTFAQRKPEIASGMRVFEIDRPGTQAWKRQRLDELGFGVPDWLRFVTVDFEAGGSWRDALAADGFDAAEPAVVVSTGVSMYIGKDATADTLRQIAALAPGSTAAMTFMLPLDRIEPEERPGRESTERFAKMAGTPFISLFSPAEMLALAGDAGFTDVRHISAESLAERYFTGRTDGLRPSSSEELVVATV